MCSIHVYVCQCHRFIGALGTTKIMMHYLTILPLRGLNQDMTTDFDQIKPEDLNYLRYASYFPSLT